MKLTLTRRALRDYDRLPPSLQTLVDKQLSLLLSDLRHPSLRAKKYDEKRHVWQGRVSRGYRFYFTVEGDTYCILTIIEHPK